MLKTQEQSGSKVLFQQRSGQITASKLKSSVCTDIIQPSKSLIRGIIATLKTTNLGLEQLHVVVSMKKLHWIATFKNLGFIQILLFQ